MTAPSPRKYGVGDSIPNKGVVVEVMLTAYRVESGVIVPFYGPNGVDDIDAVEGLVTFADGSRFVSAAEQRARDRHPSHRGK